MRQPNAVTGDSSESLKGQMVVQRFRPRDLGDLGAATYAAVQTVPVRRQLVRISVSGRS